MRGTVLWLILVTGNEMNMTLRKLRGLTLGLGFSLLNLFAGSAQAIDLAGNWNATPDCPAYKARLVVLGDSLADGLWGAFYRRYARCEMLEVVRLTKVSDGLAKTNAAGWLARYQALPNVTDPEQKDIILVQLGANDLTNLRQGTNRTVFNSPDWDTAYADRVRELGQGLVAAAGDVIWFSLPIVGKDSLRENYDHILDLQSTALKGLPIKYIDTYKLTSFGTDEFTMNARIDGKLRQMRADDRIHFTTVGYEVVAQAVLTDLEKFLHLQDSKIVINNVALQ